MVPLDCTLYLGLERFEWCYWVQLGDRLLLRIKTSETWTCKYVTTLYTA